MNIRKIIYDTTKIQLPSSKPLWKLDEGLQSIVKDDGSAKSSIPGIPYDTLTEPQKREKLYNEMLVNQNIVDLKGKILIYNIPKIVDNKVNSIIANKERYETISHTFPNPIKWYHVALIHEMECTQNFNCYLGNGQRWNKKTTIVPTNRGPFKSFEEGAIDAIKFDKLDKVLDWSIGNTLYILEAFNGLGYAKYRGINSPYIWSGSNKYQSGKYIADNVYSKNAVSTQIGIALMLHKLEELKII